MEDDWCCTKCYFFYLFSLVCRANGYSFYLSVPQHIHLSSIPVGHYEPGSCRFLALVLHQLRALFCTKKCVISLFFFLYIKGTFLSLFLMSLLWEQAASPAPNSGNQTIFDFLLQDFSLNLLPFIPKKHSCTWNTCRHFTGCWGSLVNKSAPLISGVSLDIYSA